MCVWGSVRAKTQVFLTFSQTSPSFYVSAAQILKTLWEKEKLLVTKKKKKKMFNVPSYPVKPYAVCKFQNFHNACPFFFHLLEFDNFYASFIRLGSEFFPLKCSFLTLKNRGGQTQNSM